MSRLIQLENYARDLSKNFRWTNTYGFARTLLAICTLTTLTFNDINLVMNPIGEVYQRGEESTILTISLFRILGSHLVIAQYIGIAILVLVISGWRPRITGILHWWVTFSLATSGIAIDGGDQIAALLAFLLIPICLVDSRKSHWSTDKKEKLYTPKQQHWNLLAVLGFWTIRLQVAAIYFQAAISKMDSDEWLNGTALYYWSQTPLFMMPPWLDPIMTPLFSNSITLSLMTWGVLAFEILLFTGLVINKKWRKSLMISGILFHFGIVLIYGLVSFFFVMTAALILFLGPLDKGFQFSIKMKKSIKIKDLFNRLFISKTTPSRRIIN